MSRRRTRVGYERARLHRRKSVRCLRDHPARYLEAPAVVDRLRFEVAFGGNAEEAAVIGVESGDRKQDAAAAHDDLAFAIVRVDGSPVVREWSGSLKR